MWGSRTANQKPFWVICNPAWKAIAEASQVKVVAIR